MRKFLQLIFTDYPKEYIRPILVSVSTAAILAIGAWIWTLTLPTQKSTAYPIFCTAEPYAVTEDGFSKLLIDFFIVNRSAEPLKRADLSDAANKGTSSTSPKSSGTIYLRYTRTVGSASVREDSIFNAHKAVLRVEKKDQSNDIEILIDSIEPRAVLLVTIVVRDLPNLKSDVTVKRTAKGWIPYDYQPLQDACYSPGK